MENLEIKSLEDLENFSNENKIDKTFLKNFNDENLQKNFLEEKNEKSFFDEIWKNKQCVFFIWMCVFFFCLIVVILAMK